MAAQHLRQGLTCSCRHEFRVRLARGPCYKSPTILGLHYKATDCLSSHNAARDDEE